MVLDSLKGVRQGQVLAGYEKVFRKPLEDLKPRNSIIRFTML